MRALLSALRNTIGRFGRSDRGNVMLTFALATIPMIGFVGAAVDYSRANSAKAAMQAAVDATGLMLSKNVTNMNSADLNTKANSYFNALLNRPEVSNIAVTPTYTSTGGYQLVVTAKGKVATTFMKVMGQSELNIDVSSTVKWGNTKLRMALVLDTTGSMADDNKIEALRTATKNLLNQLQKAAPQNGDIYVSIIPFSKDVNVGSANNNAIWIDWTEWEDKNGNCNSSKYKTKTNCVANGKKWNTANHNTWNGCVMDRGGDTAPSVLNTDTNASAPTPPLTDTMFAAEEYASCSPQVMPLSYDWNAMQSLVSKLYPAGNTNQGIGLAHGWMSLVGGGPYPTPPPMDPNYTYSRVIILMSDGLNTQNRWYNNQAQIDARQQLTCNNVKAAGITIYTIHVNTGGDPMSTLLQNCASSPDKFFHLTSANALVATFDQIGTKLSNLRVAK